MQTFIVEYLTTNRFGGLVDKVATVRATSADEARAKFAAKHPAAAVGFVGLDSEYTSIDGNVFNEARAYLAAREG